MLDEDSQRGGLAREEMLAQIAALMEETRTVHARVEGLRGGIAALDGELEAARGERETLGTAQTQLEAELRAGEQEERETAAGGERDRTRLAQVEAELGMLVSQFAQNPATGEECADVEGRYRDEPDAIGDELPRMRDELLRLQANVNLNAESERTEVAEREQFLRTQMEDLAKARETLLESIREIERETQVQFNETFTRVSEAFSQMYARLFVGGEARMWQTQPENLSETGIEIAVRPPGKKAMPLAALSGGERAMSAAALIFALIATKPAPFYLLDEVDASLDDANIERFCTIVREFAAESQMLIVTHNKKTMETADRIYGVTTREAGISAIVSARARSRSRGIACLNRRAAGGRRSSRLFDKTGAAELARTMTQRGVEIYATGGTRTFLRERDIPAHDVEELTGFPALFSGRVKTLHPKVFGGFCTTGATTNTTRKRSDTLFPRSSPLRSISIRSKPPSSRRRDARRSDRRDRYRRRRAASGRSEELRTRSGAYAPIAVRAVSGSVRRRHDALGLSPEARGRGVRTHRRIRRRDLALSRDVGRSAAQRAAGRARAHASASKTAAIRDQPAGTRGVLPRSRRASAGATAWQGALLQ